MELSRLNSVLAYELISRSTQRSVVSRLYFRVSVLIFGYYDFASLLFEQRKPLLRV